MQARNVFQHLIEVQNLIEVNIGIHSRGNGRAAMSELKLDLAEVPGAPQQVKSLCMPG